MAKEGQNCNQKLYNEYRVAALWYCDFTNRTHTNPILLWCFFVGFGNILGLAQGTLGAVCMNMQFPATNVRINANHIHNNLAITNTASPPTTTCTHTTDRYITYTKCMQYAINSRFELFSSVRSNVVRHAIAFAYLYM